MFAAVRDMPKGRNMKKKTKPMPKIQPGRPLRYPFDDLEIGDDFELRGDDKAVNALRVGACNYGKRHGVKFSIQRTKKGAICYRVK